MELVRLYYNSMDVRPSVLVRHFVRYLGLYIEENIEKGKINSHSLADIYIISDASVGDEDTVLEVPYEDKTILIMMDGFKTDDLRIKTIYYSDDPFEDKGFLEQLSLVLNKVIESYGLDSPVLMQSDPDYQEVMESIIDAYVSNNLLQASLFGRCFYGQTALCDIMMEKYEKFIATLENKYLSMGKSDLLEYAVMYAKYELDLICKKNLRNFSYASGDLLDKCIELLDRHTGNEELYLLRADIQYELQDRWLWACDDFADPHISHCAYADYRRGKIFRAYLEEYDNAEYLLKRAVQRKKDYIYAWYQLGICYEKEAKFQKAIHSFNQIKSILSKRYKRHLLAPFEVEYLYNAVMRVAVIYKIQFWDYDSAYAYNDLAESIRASNVIEGYLEQLWIGIEEMGNEEVYQIIDKALKQEIDIKLDKIY